MSQSKSAEAVLSPPATWCLIASASFRVASVHPRLLSFHLPPTSMGKSVARRCSEDTSIAAKTRYEADVSGKSVKKGLDALFSAVTLLSPLSDSRSLGSLADKTRACGLFAGSPQNIGGNVFIDHGGRKRGYCHCFVQMCVVHEYTLAFRGHHTSPLSAIIRHHWNLSTS